MGWHASVPWLDEYSWCIEVRMTNMPMPLSTHVEVRPEVIVQTDVAVMNVTSISRVRNFVTFFDEASCPVRSLQMKSESKMARLLRCQVCWVQRESRWVLKKIVLDGQRIIRQGLEKSRSESYWGPFYCCEQSSREWKGRADDKQNQ